MNDRASHPWFWGAVGASLALVAVFAPLLSGGSLAQGLRVGETSTARQFIERELGPVPLVPSDPGHDGQYNYLIARDPAGLEGTIALADDPPYRLRRPLLGWLGGAFGALPPHAALAGLALWPALAVGLATAAAERIRSGFGGRWWAILGVLANPGVWLAVELRTSDTLVLAGGLWALVYALETREKPAAAALASAALSKEAGVVFAIPTALELRRREDRRGAVVALVVPLLVLGAWMAVVATTTGNPLSAKGSLDIPFSGWVAILDWNTGDVALGSFALFAVALALFALWRGAPPLLRDAMVPWLVVASVSSILVWESGNNAARVFSSLLSLAVLAVAVGRDDRISLGRIRQIRR